MSYSYLLGTFSDDNLVVVADPVASPSRHAALYGLAFGDLGGKQFKIECIHNSAHILGSGPFIRL